MKQEVFVIGDVHGHLDRLMALLEQDSWCIDIGNKGVDPAGRCLAGIWLPSLEVAEVRLG